MKLLLTIILLIITSTLYAQQQEIEPRFQLPNWDSIDKTIIGTEYVPFSITTLSGQTWDNTSVKGKVVFFTFWAKSCAPCIKEFPELNELYAHFSNDTNVVFVAITSDKEEHITDVLEKFKVTFPVASVSSTKPMNYGRGYPSAVLLDKKGIVREFGYISISDTDSKNMVSKMLSVDSAARLINSYN